MASNYGDLSRQLELGVSTFFLFFLQITELEKTEGGRWGRGFKCSLPRRGRRGKLMGVVRVDSQTKIFTAYCVGFKQRGGRSLQVKFQLAGIAAAAE